MLRWTYNLLFPFAFLALLPGFLRRMFRRGNYQDQFWQRFGYYSCEVRERLAEGSPRPWLQAVSVGEILVALKLIGALRERCPGLPLVLSTTTTTGMQLARERVPAGVEVVYTPIDSWFAVRRAYDALRPSQVTIVDGGLWPNLLWEARRRGIPVALASARLSPRSEGRFRRFERLARAMFGLLDLVCVSEPDDLARWVGLGVDQENLVCTGNIKFDDEVGSPPPASLPADYLGKLGLEPGAPVILAASTHPGEERILAETFLALRQQLPSLFLILAPRHVERVPEVLEELTALGLSSALRSTPWQLPRRPDVLLLDTTGELRYWPAEASVVFIGKSLTAVGGQNPAEAAAAGRAAVFGPHMENFSALTAALLAARAAILVQDPVELAAQLLRLLEDPIESSAMGERARAVLGPHRGAARRTVQALVDGGGFSPCE